MVEIQDGSFRYDLSVQVLNKVNLSISEPGVYGLLGDNGAGKSTLLRILAKIYTLNSGRISVPTSFGMLSDKFGLYKNLTVEQNLLFHCNIAGVEDDLIQETFLDICEGAGFLKTKVKLLSSGQKQLVKIVRAFLTNSNLILLDEPFANLDDKSKRNLKKVLIRKGKEKAVILSTHQLLAIEEITKNVFFLKNGNLVCLNFDEYYAFNENAYYVILDKMDEQSLKEDMIVHFGPETIKVFRNCLVVNSDKLSRHQLHQLLTDYNLQWSYISNFCPIIQIVLNELAHKNLTD
ncbi:ATP-binding cassette domain-containing protein [Neolewinella agarilytica]|uniref:ABC-type multidrug transport system, ATPase component n=1 Tax=Neolewinella agarilytica TaxID=478744 RepID=A0A1H9ATC8_9BACT|nr:ABC transporter ATP-binding protein [Neolewinella agarilytica]SEP80044.1 ABC-type multidrug transport system, ATPase component [Neolewinella agarilytica]